MITYTGAKLYRMSSTGKLLEWDISVDDCTIVIRYGQVGGKIQETMDVISEGKNIGKSNETSAKEQAILEAKSKWEKQKKKGYVEDLESALKGIDEVPGFKPMLAHRFDKQSSKITYPAVLQPKLDGMRCCAVIKNGAVSLYSRTGKPITAVPHIEEELSKVFPEGNWKLDGELYNHDFKDKFEELMSIVSKKDKVDEEKVMQYHIYDMVADDSFIDRIKKISDIVYESHPSYLHYVYIVVVDEESSIEKYVDMFLDMGYEGAMIRNKDSLYENKRSYNLQKIKNFIDDEFKIVGIEEGRGRLAGHVGSFVCIDSKGSVFNAKMKGSTSKLKSYFEDHSLWKDKMLTVQYFGLTTKEGVPRFPVGKCIRSEFGE